ncbi:uncharacterized protein [Pyrus communis]|uniref:uncharacterized protein n=1 Tax=Pyrus communis TaxID=23211 RepID=UPI0035BFD795
MFVEAFKTINVAEHLLDHSVSPLISFSGDVVQPLGSVHLPFTIGIGPYTTTITTNFLVVDCPTAYNVIFGRTGINDLKAIVSTHMLLMKFPTPYGNGYIRGDQLSARSCYNTSVKQQHLHVPKETFSIHDQAIKTSSDKAHLNIHCSNNQPDDPQDYSFTQQAQPAEELENVSISKDYPDRIVKIGTILSPPIRLALISFLQENTEVFAWSYEDMPGIYPDIICYRLSIDPKTKPIGKNMEVYVDDMLVKSKHADQHIANFFKTFSILKKYRMSQRGIEANPEKIKEIMDMKEPLTSKDIQSLTGKMAALTRFISKATDKCAPFFKALKGSKKYITWTNECAEAFKNLKEYMSKAPLLSKPKVGDTLIVYLSVSAVSFVLIRSDGSIERPIYYASKAL